jgi:hypothetical protein
MDYRRRDDERESEEQRGRRGTPTLVGARWDVTTIVVGRMMFLHGDLRAGAAVRTAGM